MVLHLIHTPLDARRQPVSAAGYLMTARWQRRLFSDLRILRHSVMILPANRRLKMKRRLCVSVLLLWSALLPLALAQASGTAKTTFEVSYPGTLDPGPITGRVFVIVSKSDMREPRLQAGSYGGSVPFFGVDVSQMKPGDAANIDAATLGFPLASLSDLPAGDYSVQALLNVYTEFHRQDGHVIWAHRDRWEGQQWNRSPGNLVSDAMKVKLDPATGFHVKLSLSRKLPEIEVPPDTPWVKRVKIQSPMLTKFWGQPIYIGAAVLLPKGYDSTTSAKYPAVYIQGHFSLGAPFGFSTQPPGRPETEEQAKARRQRNARETGYEFYQTWNSDDFPRMIAVTFQHPTPYYDDSYAVNSANNGPYGEALTRELIPYLEEKFRILPQPSARVLTGGSTGGWEALALQVFYPTFFNGTWVFYPDPVDFRRYQVNNIYDDENAFEVPNGDWAKMERPLSRTPEGQVTLTMREMSRLEAVLGSHVRSGQQLAAWDAAYGPVGPDGYPRPVWDRLTGKIDKDVAAYMRDNGYDLRFNLEKNWSRIGKDLTGKIHIYVGDMDNYYLNLAVYLLQDFLDQAENPRAEAVFEYGRPMKGHGWQPMSSAEMVRAMARRTGHPSP
jgi:Putative esterase